MEDCRKSLESLYAAARAQSKVPAATFVLEAKTPDAVAAELVQIVDLYRSRVSDPWPEISKALDCYCDHLLYVGQQRSRVVVVADKAAKAPTRRGKRKAATKDTEDEIGDIISHFYQDGDD